MLQLEGIPTKAMAAYLGLFVTGLRFFSNKIFVRSGWSNIAAEESESNPIMSSNGQIHEIAQSSQSTKRFKVNLVHELFNLGADDVDVSTNPIHKV